MTRGESIMSVKECRFKVVRRGLFWRIKTGTGTRVFGRFFRQVSALRMCSELSTAYEDGRFSVGREVPVTQTISGAWIRCPKCGEKREIGFTSETIGIRP